MAVGSGPKKKEEKLLEITIDHERLPVSSLSSLLRVVQAALREEARSGDDTRQFFLQKKQPVLIVSIATRRGEVTLQFSFTDQSDCTPLSHLSEYTFGSFMDKFSRLFKTLPQRGLWGEVIGGIQHRQYESDVARRVDQVRLELQRFPKAKIRFDHQTILFEDGRMVIE